MFHDILFLVLGLSLLVVGANYVTDGAVAVARRFGVSNLMIGLTVVALGSSMPDIVVCVESAFQHKAAIAMGEVIGANIFDLLLVVGLMCIVRPWKPDALMRTQDLPILLISSVALWFAGDSVLFDGAHHNIIDRSGGLLLILIFGFYMWFMIMSTRQRRVRSSEEYSASDLPGTEDTAPATNTRGRRLQTILKNLKKHQWFNWFLIIGGLGALVIGGNWVVDGASGVALKSGMSQAMVALTIVAIGNALPDLVTSLTATLKGASGIAFGNIVGSCIFNSLLTVGLSATVTPLKADSIGFVDFFTLVGASALVWGFMLLGASKRATQAFGIALVMLYGAYMAFTIIRG